VSYYLPDADFGCAVSDLDARRFDQDPDSHPVDRAFSAAIAVIDSYPKTSPLIAAKCKGLMYGYHHRWANSPMRVLAVEKESYAPLFNVLTNRKSRQFTIAGKIDAIVEIDGELIIIDHKTASDEIEDPSAPYWKLLVVDSQPSHYMLLEWLNGNKIDGAVWDVARKPSISPKQLNKSEIKKLSEERRYFGYELSEEDIVEMNVRSSESYAMYCARLAYDCTFVRPGRYFQRRRVGRLDSELIQYAKELWGVSREIASCRGNGMWIRNPGACMLYGRPCEYLGICSGYEGEDDRTLWSTAPCVHRELSGVEGDGKDIITNSRTRCFLDCRRKHFYQYELGLNRIERAESEAIAFGSLWHAALEAWFKAQMLKE